MKKKYLASLLLGSTLSIIIVYNNAAWLTSTSHGHAYKNESTLPQALQSKIIVFSYGSLVKQKKNSKTGNMLCAEEFAPTDIEVPVSFTFLAGYPLTPLELRKPLHYFPRRRATLTIDIQSSEIKRLWAAQSQFHNLDNARNNLAAREGSPFKGKRQGYDLEYILYVRKISRFYPKKEGEIDIDRYADWVTKKAFTKQQQLPMNILKKIIQYLQEKNATAAIWASLPKNTSVEKVIELLKDDIFLRNTKEYIDKLPLGNPLTRVEQRVLDLIHGPR